MLNYPVLENEAERLLALQSYHIFDTAEEKDFDDLAALASAICQIPIALITFIDDKRQWFKSHHGTDFTENERGLSFCTHAIASSNDIMIVPDAKKDSRFADNPIVTGGPEITFYAGVPLINEDGYALGTMCVLDQQTHDLSEYQIEALKTLARQVVDKLELRRKVAILEKSNESLMSANVLIQKFASMAAHDIKNPITSISLTSQALKRRYEKSGDESSLKLVDMNIEATKNLLELVDEMLEYSKSPDLLISKKQTFDFKSLIEKIITLIDVPETTAIELPETKSDIHLSVIAFEQIMINLLTNAIRYNDKDRGYVKVRFAEEEHHYHFEVEDNGRGIPEEYHEKIFSDNFTLKISDRYNKKGSGIGLSTVKDLVTALNGNVSLKSVPGEGTTFFISIRK
ncbi:GAF domain-containing sensor histidine kinase [Daejeonella sp.]|uniref:sensor histidine kinase n=1 Tax=Daejeonella sp. TaxID=2805397 RepID=UPI0030C5C341